MNGSQARWGFTVTVSLSLLLGRFENVHNTKLKNNRGAYIFDLLDPSLLVTEESGLRLVTNVLGRRIPHCTAHPKVLFPLKAAVTNKSSV